LPDKDKKSDQSKIESSHKDSSNVAASVSDSVGKAKNGSIPVGLLKKKLPLTDKDLNPEFFQKLEKNGPDDLAVEVVVPRKCLNQSNPGGGETESNNAHAKDSTEKGSVNVPSRQRDIDVHVRDRGLDEGLNGKDLRARTFGIEDRGTSVSKPENQPDGSLMNGKGNWLAIQRQLLHLERQQAHLMNMLQVCFKKFALCQYVLQPCSNRTSIYLPGVHGWFT